MSAAGRQTNKPTKTSEKRWCAKHSSTVSHVRMERWRNEGGGRGMRRVAWSCGLLLSGLAWPQATPPSATTPRPVSVHQPTFCQQAGCMPARRVGCVCVWDRDIALIHERDAFGTLQHWKHHFLMHVSLTYTGTHTMALGSVTGSNTILQDKLR